MPVRTLGMGALAVAAAVLVLVLALRDSGAPAPAEPDADPVVASSSTVARAVTPDLLPSDPGRVRRTAPVRLPDPPAEPKPQPLDTTGPDDMPLWIAFDDEPRDEAWAPDQENAIRNHIRPLLERANRGRPRSVRVRQISCRQALCRLLITGSHQREFQRFVESLQDERGFYGTAALLALDSYNTPASKESGNQVYQVRVHLQYDR